MSIGANAFLLSNSVLAKWLLEDYPFRIQLAPIFPFIPIAGHELRYATTPFLPPAFAIDACAPIPEDTKNPIDPNRVFRMAELATHYRICYSAQDIFSSNVNDQAAVQAALAIRELLYKFFTLMEAGDSVNPGEFDGLLKIVDPLKVVDLNCTAVTLEKLSETINRVRSNDGRAVVGFGPNVMKRAIEVAHWKRGLSPEYEEMEFPNPRGGIRRQKVLIFDGAPFYVIDLFQSRPCVIPPPGPPLPPAAELTSNGTDVVGNAWFAVLGEGHLHAITPAALGTRLFATRDTRLPDGSTDIYHMTMPVGLALGSACSLAVLKNGKIPQP